MAPDLNPNPTPLRLAIVSTPRSGNMWLRTLLQRCYNIPTNATHELTDEQWQQMPGEGLHQIHWPRTSEFVSRLRDHGFKVITIARHPLDTLISILHFPWYSQTQKWLLGEGG